MSREEGGKAGPYAGMGCLSELQSLGKGRAESCGQEVRPLRGNWREMANRAKTRKATKRPECEYERFLDGNGENGLLCNCRHAIRRKSESGTNCEQTEQTEKVKLPGMIDSRKARFAASCLSNKSIMSSFASAFLRTKVRLAARICRQTAPCMERGGGQSAIAAIARTSV